MEAKTLALYLGCQISINGKNYMLHGVRKDGYVSIDEYTRRWMKLRPNIKPILRPLSSMTEEEEKEMIATQDDVKLEGYPNILLKADSGETFLYMLSKGFDLFGLIESGEAIDSTKL